MQIESTVFLVDDDPAVRDSLCWLMRSRNLPFHAYASATEFLDSYDSCVPGCLVLDIRMPEMSGLELQDKMAAMECRMPIIFVTGHGDVSSSVRAFRAGAADFLEKPVDHETLLAAIVNAFEKDAQRRNWEQEYPDIGPRIERLSSREQEVMELLFAGNTMKKIASELGISFQTVAKHRSQILQKLEVETDAEFARLLAGHRLRHP